MGETIPGEGDSFLLKNSREVVAIAVRRTVQE
jgi:hypothetical protein